jgi:ribonuclease/clavin/mitogillin
MFEVEPYNDDVTLVKTATAMEDGNPIMWAISYLVKNILIDAGCPNALEDLEKYAARTQVDEIYVTHAHEDHYGGCSAFAHRSTIYATEPDIKILKNPPILPEFFQFVWGQPTPLVDVEKMPSQFSVGDLQFEVIPLPGHWQHMVGFYEPHQKWLFSADAVPLPTRKFIAMPEENIPVMVDTMQRIAEMDIEILFDAHKGPVTSPKEHIQARIDFIMTLQKRVLKLHEEGKSIPEIQEVLGLEGPWYLGLTENRFRIDHFLKSLVFDKVEK